MNCDIYDCIVFITSVVHCLYFVKQTNKQNQQNKIRLTKNAEFELTICVHVRRIRYMQVCLLAGVKNIKQVSLGIQHILADVIAKNSETMSSIKKM